MTSGTWVSTYFRDGSEIGRGIWSFETAPKNETFDDEEEFFDDFDPESLPSVQVSDDEDSTYFEHSFQYAAGPNFVSYQNAQNGTEEFTQVVSIVNNGQPIAMTIEMGIDGDTLSANFTDMLSETFVNATAYLSWSMNDQGEWATLIEESDESSKVQVQVSARQFYDPEWYVPESDWKIQIYVDSQEIYLSSYVNMTTGLWVTTFFSDGDELGRGIWYFETALQNETFVDGGKNSTLNETFVDVGNSTINETFIEGNTTHTNYTKYVVEQDLSGSYIAHLDLRLSNVSEGNHTVNFTGYSNENNTWVLGRSIDYDHITYSTELTSDGKFGFWFSSSGNKKYIYCDTEIAGFNCTGSVRVDNWNATLSNNAESFNLILSNINAPNFTIVEEIALEYPTVNLTINANNTSIWNRNMTLNYFDPILTKKADGQTSYTDEQDSTWIMSDSIMSFPGLHNQTMSVEREFSNGTNEVVIMNQFVGFDNLDDYPYVSRTVLVQAFGGEVLSMTCSFIDTSVMAEWDMPPREDMECEDSMINGTFFYTMRTNTQSANLTVRSTPQWSGPSLQFENSVNLGNNLIARKDMIDGQVVSEREFDLNSNGSNGTNKTEDFEDKEDVTPEPERLEFEISREEKEDSYTE